jgi:hypothetical protein
MNGTGALPTFFIIGAAKAGTTSLHHYLGQHPEIQMSSVKEPMFFARPDDGAVPAKGRIGRRDEYEALFDPAVAVRGESSPNYSCHPIRPGVPDRIQAAVPQAKLLYLVRDPVERTLSHHRHAVALGEERRTLAAALGDLRNPLDKAVTCMSMYAHQIERYRASFEADRLLVLDNAELAGERARALREIFAFLGVEPRFESAAFERELYRGNTRRRYPPGWEHVVGLTLGPRVRWVPPRVRRSLRSTTERLLFRAVEEPELDADLKGRLQQLYGPDVARLRSLTGRRFSSWSV